MTPILDREFALLARERTMRRPLRTYVYIPIVRAGMMWFTPRVELLPYSGELWPPAAKWRGNPVDFDVTLAFGFLGFVYFGLALAGAWHCRASPGLVLIVAYIAIRTAALTQLQTVEPRYVIVCFPAVLALGALAWTAPQTDASAQIDAAVAPSRIASPPRDAPASTSS
jgi:hypothetical protein